MTADAHASPLMTSLGDALPRLNSEQARLQRLGFDARFERWLAQRLDLAELKVVTTDPARAFGTCISLRAPRGRATVRADLSAWPAAQLALAADDSALAEALGNALLADLFNTFGDVVPGLGLQAMPAAEAPSPRCESMAYAVPTIVVPGLSVALCSCEGDVLQAFEDAVSSTAPEFGRLTGMTLVGRLRLQRRMLPVGTLSSLSAGDVLLLGDGGGGVEAAHVLQYGVGITMQAPTEINIAEQTVTVAGAAAVAADPTDSAESLPQPEGLSDLMLPVSFEIDTAALSLAELGSIRPGYVVELAVPLLEAVVRLVCHGQTIGSGQLVAIGDQLGVRINRMTTGHDFAAHR